jgi:hypothetical protein
LPIIPEVTVVRPVSDGKCRKKGKKSDEHNAAYGFALAWRKPLQKASRCKRKAASGQSSQVLPLVFSINSCDDSAERNIRNPGRQEKPDSNPSCLPAFLRVGVLKVRQNSFA